MESDHATDHYEDNHHGSYQSVRSGKKNSRASSTPKHKKNSQDKIQDEEEKDTCEESRSKTRIRQSASDPDEISDGDGRRGTGSFYSEDYENESPSERSLSPYSQSPTPSPTPQKGLRAKRISGSPFSKTGGVGHPRLSRPPRLGGQPLSQQHRRGVRSYSKESSPPKDLDLVTKRMLSARLLKINELRNALAELQQRTDELQKENRILRQLQVRQEKALQRYDDTESEISQLIARHSNETHVLRERLRRTQERERAAERRLKDSEEQLQRSQATNIRLKKLVDQRELGARAELSRRVEEEKARVQEAERKIKELERSIELSNSSFQRQLAAERKKTTSAQEEIRTLQEELGRLTNKLKERERELDARNIYANRLVKTSQRKDAENCTKLKVPCRNNTKAVQTEDEVSSLDFPTPPPALTDASNYNERGPDEYLSLKELGEMDRQRETEDRPQTRKQQEMRDKKKERDEERQLNQDLDVLDEKTKRLRDGWEKETDEKDGNKKSSLLNSKEKEDNRKCGHVQDEVKKWNHASQEAAEEARHRKELLLAKMREIDCQNQEAQASLLTESSDSNKATSDHSSPCPPEQRSHYTSIFTLTAPEESHDLRPVDRGAEGGRRRSGIEVGATGRRAQRSQLSSDDLAFGSYAPSFGPSPSRGSSGFPPPPPKEDRDSALEAIGVFSLKGVETEKEKDIEKGGDKDKKASLMQQLFGALATPAGDTVTTSNKMEVLSGPPTTNGVRSRRDRLLSLNIGCSSPPSSSLNILHVADSRPAIRAITSFDDDIEELTL